VLSRVGEGLLSHAVEGEPRVGVERTGLARHGQLGTVAGGDCGQLFGQGDRFVAKRVDGLTRLFESLHRESPRLLEEVPHPRCVLAVLEEGVGGIELDRERTK